MEMLIEQIIEFELRGPGPPGCTCAPITGYFHDKTNILPVNNNLLKSCEWIRLLFNVKILHEAMHSTFPYLGQITYEM